MNYYFTAHFSLNDTHVNKLNQKQIVNYDNQHKGICLKWIAWCNLSFFFVSLTTLSVNSTSITQPPTDNSIMKTTLLYINIPYDIIQ